MEWVLQGAYPSQDVVYNPFDGTFGAVGSFGTYGCRWTYFINKKGIKEIEDNEGETLISEGIDANYFDIINYAIFVIIYI